MSRTTVASYLREAFSKLGARNMPHAVALALCGGLIVGCAGEILPEPTPLPEPTLDVERVNALMDRLEQSLDEASVVNEQAIAVNERAERNHEAWEQANAHLLNPAPLVNLNTATLAELDTLPGIGPVLAQRIIDARPYLSIDDLLRVEGIGFLTVNELAHLVTVE